MSGATGDPTDGVAAPRDAQIEGVVTSLIAEPKIDTHCHVLDPARFPYRDDTPYRPSGQEVGTVCELGQMFDAYSVKRALLVGPNSGYEQDNRCLLDALVHGAGRFKGIAVVAHDIATDDLKRLKMSGIAGVAFNATYHGVDHYRDTADLLARLARLDMCLSLQVERDQLVALAPMIERSGVRLLIDHCGRPATQASLDQPGFRRLLALAAAKRTFVKLSGYVKFARADTLYEDAKPFVDALLDAFSPDACMWASDWPFLRAARHVDVGSMLALFGRLVPDRHARRRIFWDTPARVLGFSA